MTTLLKQREGETDLKQQEQAETPIPFKRWRCTECGEHFLPHEVKTEVVRLKNGEYDYEFRCPCCQSANLEKD